MRHYRTVIIIANAAMELRAQNHPSPVSREELFVFVFVILEDDDSDDEEDENSCSVPRRPSRLALVPQETPFAEGTSDEIGRRRDDDDDDERR